MFNSFSSIDSLFYVFSFILGACLGSFANVVIYRLPQGKSVVTPRSHCPSCLKMIPLYHNIPIISWLLLRGKCSNCGAKFSIRYLMVELLTAILFTFSYHYAPSIPHLIEQDIFIFGLVVCTFIDLDHMILPDEFTLSGIIIGLIGAAINPYREFMPALIGVFIGGGFLWATAYFYFMITKQDGMGGGDIKLLGWIGAVLGWQAVPFVIMSSAIIGSLVGLMIARRSKTGLKTVIPFGPYLALGALLYLFGGQSISDWYFGLFLPQFVGPDLRALSVCLV